MLSGGTTPFASPASAGRRRGNPVPSAYRRYCFEQSRLRRLRGTPVLSGHGFTHMDSLRRTRLALVDHAQVLLIARAALAAALGFLVGWERHIHGSPAGDRTHALVAVGASAFTTVGVVNFPSTAEKLIAGIVTGIGFLGAG